MTPEKKIKRRRTDALSPTRSDDIDRGAVGQEGNDASADCVGLGDLRNLALPSKSWTPHEFPNFPGVSYVACTLDSRSNELAIDRAVFFDCSSQDSVECKVLVSEKLVNKCRLMTMQEATELLQSTANIPVCCGAAEASFVAACELTKALHA